MKFVKQQPWLIFIGLLVCSFASSANIKISDATVRLLPPTVPNTAAYFKIQNTSNKDVVLVSASTDIAEKAELHAHVMENGMMSMQQQEQIKIPAGETVAFKPGGLHVMIFGLKKPLSENQRVLITLVSEDQKTIQVEAKAVMPGKEKSHSHH
ncbi:copper chaperone PCu(A)C [Aliiglaciecola sp. 2_MG-2023]|uniref:copper chaperone PCu(A)C n=1 Tax=Alteromonadaceae TaxID=72275 RepID=UPI0026E1352E|nr:MULTISPECIES: copper chaperone PCu(A)C [unclassified Aliiglaciecola]MDO6709547.1 copper chaperone PCu(A)C [Aliiglaciecola sp. 2_MG-2023]MDO6750911.1 copper chaperone PCu(A)C [Aliiglaciecola sp. 1_MG-2023]